MRSKKQLKNAVEAGLELLNFLDVPAKEKLKIVFHFTSYMDKEGGFYFDEQNDFCKKLFKTFEENFGENYNSAWDKLSAVNEFCTQAKALGFSVEEKKIDSTGGHTTWETIIETAPQ